MASAHEYLNEEDPTLGFNEEDPTIGFEIRILGYVTTPAWKMTATHKLNYIKTCDYKMGVTLGTTIKEVKDFTLARFPTLNYYQMEFQFWDRTLKDAITIKDVCLGNKFFMTVNCLDLFIIIPNAKFKETYKAFREMGMHEEKALERTTSIMEKVAEDNNFDYEIAMKLELCRERLQQCKLKYLNDCKKKATQSRVNI